MKLTSLEYCDICDQPTGGAGRGDDSLVCWECDKVICKECQVDGLDNVVLCKECYQKIKLRKWLNHKRGR